MRRPRSILPVLGVVMILASGALLVDCSGNAAPQQGGTATAAEPTGAPEIEADFHQWRQTSTPPEYRHLAWDEDAAADQTTSEEADTLL